MKNKITSNAKKVTSDFSVDFIGLFENCAFPFLCLLERIKVIRNYKKLDNKEENRKPYCEFWILWEYVK